MESTQQAKLNAFEQRIMSRVTRECAATEAEVQEYRRSQLEQYQAQLVGQASSYLEKEYQEIVTACARESYRQKAELRQKLLTKREEYCKEVFAAAAQELLTFSQGEKYLPFLQNKLSEMGKGLLSGEQVILYVREQDVSFATALQTALGHPCEVHPSQRIALGGVLLESPQSHYRIDQTLDTLLNEQREWFYSHSDLAVNL